MLAIIKCAIMDICSPVMKPEAEEFLMKTNIWPAEICGIEAEWIRDLINNLPQDAWARSLAGRVE